MSPRGLVHYNVFLADIVAYFYIKIVPQHFLSLLKCHGRLDQSFILLSDCSYLSYISIYPILLMKCISVSLRDTALHLHLVFTVES